MGPELFDRLSRAFGSRVEKDAPLGAITTYRVGGGAAVAVTVESVDDLVELHRILDGHAVPMLVVGRGSNMLVADSGFDGIVVRWGGAGDSIDVPTDGSAPADEVVTVTAGAMALLPVVARRTAAVGLSGFEWAVGVPGSIGGALRMNAGGHGSDMAASLIDAEIFDITSGSLSVRSAADLGLRFRGSDLSDEHVVVRARLALHCSTPDRTTATIDEIVRWRRENQPGGQNAGSVFVNPVPGEVSAGELIDRVGLRGFRIGSAEVSEKHANFIQADENGRAADVRAVMRHVHRVVLDGTGFDLRSEVRLVGFDGDSDG